MDNNNFPYYEDMGYYEGPSNFGKILRVLLLLAGTILIVYQFL